MGEDRRFGRALTLSYTSGSKRAEPPVQKNILNYNWELAA